MDPLNILPPELWEKVFHRLNAPQDWLSLYRAHPFFERLVGDERSQVLFKEALPYVLEHLEEGWAQILRLRLVSRRWKEGLDELLANPELGIQSKLNYTFRKSNKIFAFLQKFENHPTNPFIGRSITLVYIDRNKSAEHISEFQNLVLDLMYKFGGELKTLRILYAVKDYFMDSETFLLRLRNVLQLVPNLHTLEIVDSDPEHEIGADLVQKVEALGVPVLPNLKSLTSKIRYERWASSKRHRVDWNNVLISMCCNPNSLTKIQLDTIPAQQLNNFPNLRSAKLSLQRVEDVADVSNAKWPMISQLTWESKLLVNPARVFNHIEHFRDTLTDLCINISRSFEQSARDFECRVDLPRLKFLEVCCPPTLNYFVNLSSLEILSVQGWDAQSDHSNPKEIIQLCGFEESMRESNLWQVFPKLREFQLRLRGSRSSGEDVSSIYTRR